MRITAYSKAALVLTCLIGPYAAAQAQAAEPVSPTLQSGDHVLISVLGEEKELSGEFEVAPDSGLKHPLYSQVKVVGVPLPLLKERFAAFLRGFQKEPRLEVEPLFKVSLGGEVKTPNIYFLAPETTVADAVARANGSTNRADVDHVTVLRGGKTLSLNLNPTAPDRDRHTVQSGDQINLKPQRNVISGISSAGPLLAGGASLLSVIALLMYHHR